MILPKFDFHEPVTLEQAVQIMGELGREAKPLAGGTDLLVNMKKKILSPAHLVSLTRIDPLKQVVFSDSLVKIGPCVTAAQLADSERIQKHLPALCQGAGSLGSPLIRNLATVAGNLVSARPAADLPPPLMAYGAKVVLVSQSGRRSLPLEDFFQGPGETAIKTGEILSEIVMPLPPEHAGAGYVKLGLRQALEISLVNVAAYLLLDRSGGTILSSRIVLGAVAPTPVRAPSAEKILIGKKPGQILFAQAGTAASRDSQPINDFRGSAAYRRDMVAVLTRRALNMALEEAGYP